MNALDVSQKNYLNYCVRTYYEAIPIQQSLASKSFIFEMEGHGMGEIVGWDLVHVQASDLEIPKQPSGKIKDRPGGLHIYTEESQEYLERVYKFSKGKDPVKGAQHVKFSPLIPGRYGHSWTFPKDCNLKQSVELVKEAFKNTPKKGFVYNSDFKSLSIVSKANNEMPLLIRANEIAVKNKIKQFYVESYFPNMEGLKK